MKQFLVLSCCVSLIGAHVRISYYLDAANQFDFKVSLTYPKARKYDLDFLDTVRTPPPCGMSKDGHFTTLMADVATNVSWHLAYPHRGGYRLELLDRDGKFLLDLIKRDKSQDYILGDPTAQWHTITIPKHFICDDCTIRLRRQASEWSNSYGFWSCADVKIVSKSAYAEDCFGHGTVSSGGACRCDTRRWGPRCQFEDDCSTDADCEGGGKCVDLGGTALPRKQCFCPPGRHGIRCGIENKVVLPKEGKLDLSLHTKKKLSDKFMLYYKVIPEEKEIEFVMIINGTSYGALGWRPLALNKTCKLWPHLEDKTLSRNTREAIRRRYGPNPTLLRPVNDSGRGKSQSQGVRDQRGSRNEDKDPQKELSEPASEPQGQPEPERAPENEIVHGQPGPPSKKENRPNYETSKVAEAIPEPSPEFEPNSEPSDVSKSKQKFGTSEPRPEPDSEPSAEPESEPHPLERPSKPKDKPEPESEPEAEPSSKSKLDPKFSETKSEPSSEPEPESGLSSEPEPESGPSSEPEPESGPPSEPEPESGPFSEPSSINHQPNKPSKSSPLEAKHPSAEPEPEHHSGINASPEPEPEPASGHKNKLLKSSYAPKDFHSMDCIDLVMGVARGKYSRVLDYYTRDRSTPRLDEFWSEDGRDSITSATGWETNEGTTFLIFRRSTTSPETTDHDLKGEMHVIWARGQEVGNYVHSPPSGLEKEDPSIPRFYSADEIKYHGHGSQRGVTFMEF